MGSQLQVTCSYFQLNIFMKLYFPGLHSMCSPSVNAETLQRCSLRELAELLGINVSNAFILLEII